MISEKKLNELAKEKCSLGGPFSTTGQNYEYFFKEGYKCEIEEQIEKLKDIMSKFGEAHNMLAKTSLPKIEYQPISTLLASAKIELFNFYQERKTIQEEFNQDFVDEAVRQENKVSDLNAEEIELEAQRRYAIWGMQNFDAFIKREAFKTGAEWYASLVNQKVNTRLFDENERKDNAGIEKLRKYVFDNKIALPTQSIFNAIISEVERLKYWIYPKKQELNVNDAVAFGKWIHGNYTPTHSLKWIKRNIDGELLTTQEIYKIFQESRLKRNK